MHPCTLKSTYPWSVWIVIHQIWMITSTSKHVEIESYPGLLPLVTVANIGLAWDLVLKKWYHLGGNWNPGWKRAYQDVPHFFLEHSKALFPTYFFWENHISNWQVYHSHTNRTKNIAAEPATVWGNSQHSKLSTNKNECCEWNSATRSSTTDL